MIKVSAGLCRKIGGANHSSKGGSVHPIGQIAGTGKIKMEIIPRGKITKVPAGVFLPEDVAKGYACSQVVICILKVLAMSEWTHSGRDFSQGDNCDEIDGGLYAGS